MAAEWKESLVICRFKKGSRYSPLNQRTICSTSVCSNTLEREIAAHLCEYIDSNGLFNDNQFGFLWGRTVDDQLLLTYGVVSKWYDVGFIVVVLFDFTEAFDVVSHNLWLDELRWLGICSQLIDRIADL